MSEYLPIPGDYIFEALYGRQCIVMACNTRIIPGVASGIFRAAKELDSALIIEIARSESDLNGGYIGLTPAQFAERIRDEARHAGHDVWALHADHIGIKKGDEADIAETMGLVRSQIEAGYTSFAIDASHLFNFTGKSPEEELAPNIEATKKLAHFIIENMEGKDFGLEVEVGEIGRKDENGMVLTTPEEAVAFIRALYEDNLRPNLLAIANGSTHGYIYDANENVMAQVGIDIERTKSISRALHGNGFRVKIAQHGITGTPVEFIRTMFPHGDILKGNVGTFWQTVFHDVLKVYEPGLFREMREWTINKFREEASSKNLNKEEHIFGLYGKKSTKQFFERLYNLRKETVTAIEALAYANARLFIEAFRSAGTARVVREWMKSNGKHQ